MAKKGPIEDCNSYYGEYYQPLEAACKVAFESHQDPNMPCGLFLPGYFKKVTGKVSGRPEHCTTPSVPEIFQKESIKIRSSIINLLNGSKNWQTPEIDDPIEHRLWKNREWVAHAKEILGRDDPTITEMLDTILFGHDEAIIAFLKTLQVDPQSAMALAHGYSEEKLYDEAAANQLLNFLKILQTFYVAGRLEDKSHEASWNGSKAMLFKPQLTTCGKNQLPFGALIHKSINNMYLHDLYLSSELFKEAQSLIETAQESWPWPARYCSPQLAAAVLAQLHLTKNDEILNYDQVKMPSWFFDQYRNPAYYFLAVGVKAPDTATVKDRNDRIKSFGAAFYCAEDLIRTTYRYEKDNPQANRKSLIDLCGKIAAVFNVDSHDVALDIDRDIRDAASGKFRAFCEKFLQKTASWAPPKSPYLRK